MSVDDFERCTPQEFYRIWERWNELHEAEGRGEWERLRYTGLFMLQPYSRTRLKVTDVMRFPWDKEENAESPTLEGNGNEGQRKKKEEPFDAEGERRRYEAAKKRYGIE